VVVVIRGRVSVELFDVHGQLGLEDCMPVVKFAAGFSGQVIVMLKLEKFCLRTGFSYYVFVMCKLVVNFAQGKLDINDQISHGFSATDGIINTCSTTPLSQAVYNISVKSFSSSLS
jgi:hypothetical protein